MVRSAEVAPDAELGTITPAVPDVMKPSAICQDGGLMLRVAKSFQGQPRSVGAIEYAASMVASGHVEDILAIHVIGAQRHRLRLERECLLRLKPSGFKSERCIECRHTGWIESAASKGRPMTGTRCERPSWIVRSIDEPDESHAYPPRAIPAK